jgi:hypothetical protein
VSGAQDRLFLAHTTKLPRPTAACSKSGQWVMSALIETKAKRIGIDQRMSRFPAVGDRGQRQTTYDAEAGASDEQVRQHGTRFLAGTRQSRSDRRRRWRRVWRKKTNNLARLMRLTICCSRTDRSTGGVQMDGCMRYLHKCAGRMPHANTDQPEYSTGVLAAPGVAGPPSIDGG